MALGISEAVELARTIGELAKKGITLGLQEKITESREGVLNAKDEVLALRQQNQDLQGALQAQSDWQARAAAYKLVTTNGGAVVWHTRGPPEHFACPACFEAKKIQFLQDPDNYAGTFNCSGCGKTYPVRPSHSMAAQKPPVRVEEL